MQYLILFTYYKYTKNIPDFQISPSKQTLLFTLLQILILIMRQQKDMLTSLRHTK